MSQREFCSTARRPGPSCGGTQLLLVVAVAGRGGDLGYLTTEDGWKELPPAKPRFLWTDQRADLLRVINLDCKDHPACPWLTGATALRCCGMSADFHHADADMGHSIRRARARPPEFRSSIFPGIILECIWIAYLTARPR